MLTPEDIRAVADSVAPRATPEGRVNATHVAIEQALRDRYGHPSFIAALDQPGAYLSPAEPHPWATAFRAAADQLEATGAILYGSLGDDELRVAVGGLIIGRPIADGVKVLRLAAEDLDEIAQVSNTRSNAEGDL